MKGISHFFYAVYNTLFDRNVNKIIPGLHLGNYKSALDLDYIKKHEIDIIINCTPNIPFSDDLPARITKIRIPVNDSLLEKDMILMEQYFKIVLPYIYHEFTKRNKKILVHCYAGKQRSAIIVAALLYLIESKRVSSEEYPSPEKIFDIIVSKRPQAFTYGYRINFIKTFNRFFKLNKPE